MIHNEKTHDAGMSKWSMGTVLGFLTLLYIGMLVMCQELRMCYIVTHLSTIKRFLPREEAFSLRAGLVLTAANVLFATGWRKNRRVFLLYMICLLDAAVSFLAVGGVELAWKQQLKREIITVVLFYCAVQSIGDSLLHRMLHFFYWLWLLLWSILCDLSLCQFALMIGKDGTRIAGVQLLLGDGFFEHRLFGVFTSPEYGAVTSLMIMLAGAYFYMTAQRRVERVLLVLCNAPILCYQVLSGSRNAQLALYLCVFLGVWIVCLKRPLLPCGGRRKALLALTVAISVVAGAHMGYLAIKSTAEHVPNLFSNYSGPLARDAVVQSPSTDEGKETPDGGTETKGKLLERTDTKGNIGTNRFSIWKDYISLWKEYGLFGLSSTYDMRYIQEHHPELFICEYVRIHKPNDYAAGQVYHTHNGYLKTLVSTGYLGFALLMLFLFGGAIDVWRTIRKSREISPELLFPLLVVVAGCLSAIFDLELFFVFNPISYIFWLALGILMKQTTHLHGPSAEPAYL